ncbi:MAG: C39 family peptidase [Armatimonadetes bacterium]|nr:C39 family peptidase [Armatimonadota bacterium]
MKFTTAYNGGGDIMDPIRFIQNTTYSLRSLAGENTIGLNDASPEGTDEIRLSTEALSHLDRIPDGEEDDPGDKPPRDILGQDPESYYLSQLPSEYNPNEDQTDLNNNCGPAALAMALKAFGLAPSGLRNKADTNEFIEKTRAAMGASADETTTTTATQILNGALASGLNARRIDDIKLDDIDSALANSEMVILRGVPSAGKFEWDRFSGNHFLLVTGKTVRDGQTYYMVSDSYASYDSKTRTRDFGPHLVTPEQLEGYVNGLSKDKIGIAVSKPKPQPLQEDPLDRNQRRR